MTTIGTLSPVSPDGISELEGIIGTLDFQITVRVIANPGLASPRHPTHKIVAVGPEGRTSEIGAAWTKLAKTQDHAGEEFLTLTIDDPSFPRALHATAYRRKSDDAWDVIWKRPKAA